MAEQIRLVLVPVLARRIALSFREVSRVVGLSCAGHTARRAPGTVSGWSTWLWVLHEHGLQLSPSSTRSERSFPVGPAQELSVSGPAGQGLFFLGRLLKRSHTATVPQPACTHPPTMHLHAQCTRTAPYGLHQSLLCAAVRAAMPCLFLQPSGPQPGSEGEGVQNQSGPGDHLTTTPCSAGEGVTESPEGEERTVSVWI